MTKIQPKISDDYLIFEKLLTEFLEVKLRGFSIIPSPLRGEG